jgi:hypothetical protein
LRRRIVDANPDVTPAFLEKHLFSYLLAGLLDEFKVT